ncbi:hypothetical protein LXL04_033594 [Taraxacum kok-saghyz]
MLHLLCFLLLYKRNPIWPLLASALPLITFVISIITPLTLYSTAITTVFLPFHSRHSLVLHHLLLPGQLFRRKLEEGTPVAYRKNTKKRWKEWCERIRRMQSVFNREKNKYRRGYERWREEEEDGAYHQRFQRDDWYWKTDTSYGRNWSNFKKPETPTVDYSLSYHYAILGLNRSRTTPYTDNEIKLIVFDAAFRSKAMQYHPDQNQENIGKFSSFWVCVIFWLSSYVGTYLWWSYLHWLT